MHSRLLDSRFDSVTIIVLLSISVHIHRGNYKKDSTLKLREKENFLSVCYHGRDTGDKFTLLEMHKFRLPMPRSIYSDNNLVRK